MEYSNERFETGRDNIDNYWNSVTTASTATNPVTTLEGLEEVDSIARNLQYEQDADSILDFTEIDPFSEAITIPDENP